MATGDRLTGNKRPAPLPLQQSLDGSPVVPGPLQQAVAVHSPIPIAADPRVSLASIVESDRTSSERETALRAQVQSLLEYNARLSLQLQQQMQAQAHERSMFGKQLQEMEEAIARSKQQLPPATISTTSGPPRARTARCAPPRRRPRPRARTARSARRLDTDRPPARARR